MVREEVSYYNERWQQFGYANLYSQERSVFFLQALLDLGLEQPRICDLGSGAGWLTGILNTFGPTVGVELSPEAVRKAQNSYPGAHFLCADATAWEPNPGSFDVVVSQEVIEHIIEKPRYLSVVRKALRPGGYLLMTTPNLHVLNAIPKDEREAVWEIQPIELPLDREQLTSLLQDAKFKVLHTSSIVFGCGKLGTDRLVSSHKLNALLCKLGFEKVWRQFALNHDYGMYLATIAQVT